MKIYAEISTHETTQAKPPSPHPVLETGFNLSCFNIHLLGIFFVSVSGKKVITSSIITPFLFISFLQLLPMRNTITLSLSFFPTSLTIFAHPFSLYYTNILTLFQCLTIFNHFSIFSYLDTFYIRLSHFSHNS